MAAVVPLGVAAAAAANAAPAADVVVADAARFKAANKSYTSLSNMYNKVSASVYVLQNSRIITMMIFVKEVMRWDRWAGRDAVYAFAERSAGGQRCSLYSIYAFAVLLRLFHEWF